MPNGFGRNQIAIAGVNSRSLQDEPSSQGKHDTWPERYRHLGKTQHLLHATLILSWADFVESHFTGIECGCHSSKQFF
jgi:hypothetical protein